MKNEIKKLILKNKTEVLNISKFENEDILLDFIASKLNNIKIVQFYIEDKTDKFNLDLGSKIHQLCSFYEAIFIINKRLDLAKILNSDGIFLTKDDISQEQAKRLIHDDNKIISTSYKSSNSDYIIKNYSKENKIFKIG